MISKKRSTLLFLVMSIISVLCFGLFNMPKMEVYASGNQEELSSVYLYDAKTDTEYKSSVEAGKTTGYDDYRIDQPATLTATANDGFEFRGWRVKYTDLDLNPQSLFINGKIGTETTNLEQYSQIELRSTCEDINNDSKIDTATIYINLVFADLKIEPVFDYIYYNVDITSFMSFVDLSRMYMLSLDEDTVIYYAENIQEKVGGTVVSNKFTKAIMSKGAEYYYLGNIYEEGGTYFTRHNKNAYGSTDAHQLIAIDRGAFRLGQSVAIGELKVDCANDLETIDFANDKFVNITGFNVKANDNEKTLGENNKIINYHSKYHYTTSFSLSFNIEYDGKQLNTVNYIGEELYRLTLDLNMVDRYVNAKNSTTGDQYDNVYGIGNATFVVNNRGIKEDAPIDQYDSKIAYDTITTEVRDWLLSTANIEFLFSTIENGKYLVSPTQAVRLNCVDYKHTIDGIAYDYYDYVCSDTFAITNTAKDIVLTEDSVINLYYTPSVYKVEYQFRLYNEEDGGDVHLSQVAGYYNVNPTRYYKRGSEITFDTAPENVGYLFKGYYNYNYEEEKYGSISNAVINSSTPENLTVYMGYGYIKYALYLKDQSYDLILEYDGKTVRALYSVDIVVNNDVTTRVSDGFENEILLTSINIDDTFNIKALVNNGFLFDRFELDNGEDSLLLDGDMTITKELITKFATGTELDKKIIINSYEVYKTDYKLEYYIDPYLDTETGEFVEMADLSADLTANSGGVITKYYVSGVQDGAPIYDVAISDTDDNGDPIIIQKIVIENLKLFETVYLRSKSLQLPDGQQYLFNYYTANNTSALESSFVKEGDGSNLYTREERVSPDREKIYVVYSLPSAIINLFTQLKDDDNKNLNCDDTIIGLENAIIYKDGVMISPDNTGKSYKIDFEDDISMNTAEMRVELDLSNTDFGYYYAGHDFVVEGISLTSSETNDQNILVITFTCTSNIVYNLNINFKLIKYIFDLTVDGQNSPSVNDSLTVNDMTLDFDKIQGKYVQSILYNGVAIDNARFDMHESNASNMDLDNNKYVYTFADKNVLKEFVTRYGVVDGVNSMKIDLVMVYQDYTYNVGISFMIINAKGVDQERLMEYPLVEISVVRGDVAIDTIVIENNRKDITCKNIPYGADISISVDMSKMAGFKYAGWVNLNAGNNGIIVGDDIGRYSANSMAISGVVKDYNLGYSFGYIAYTLNPQYSEIEGNPRIVVNQKDSNKITKFDLLQISPAAKTESGFKFKAMYVEYKYNEATFSEDFEKLYSVVDVKNGVFTKNTEEYDESKTYYIQLEMTGNNYIENSFDLRRYVARGNDNIYIYFQYDMKLVTIDNQYDYNGSRKLTGKGTNQAKIEVSIDDFAEYKIFATSKIRPHEEAREIGPNDTVNYYDSILVKIQISDSALEQISGLRYDLRNNVTITSVSILGSNRYLSTGDNGYYELSFEMSGEIGKMPAQLEVLTISYTYQVSNCTLELTTNVVDNNFYKNDGVSLVIYASEYGFSKNNYYNNGKAIASAKMQFMASSRFNYTLKTVSGVDYTELFKISGVKVYLEGELLPLDKYENLVYINYADEEKTIVEYVDLIRILGNMRVEFVMQPIISVRTADGQYVKLTNGTYDITKLYTCDSNGVGLEQTLTIGEMTSTSVDIKAADIVVGAMKLTYRDALGFTTTPTQVGTYKVEISFDNSNEEFKWLQEFTGGLLSTINLVINPRPVTVDYDATIVEKVEKEYDSSYAYSIDKVLGYLTFEFVNNNGAKVVLPYYDAVSGDYAKFTLKSNNFNEMAKITHTTDNGEVEIASADETTYYNVRIRDIELDLSNTVNKNFILTNHEVVIYNLVRINRRALTIEGLKVNDKVNDSTPKATVDLGDYRLVNVVGSDNVTLLADKINARFVNSLEGKNKTVVVDPTLALDGFHASNYKLSSFDSTATIYPYSRTCEIDGFGTLVIKNDRGLLDSQYASLIPVNAVFNVELIESGHSDYNTVRRGVANYLSRMQVFGYGYELYFTVGGERVGVDRNLYLVAPETSNIAEILWFNGENGKIEFKDGDIDKTILIDLAQVKGNVTYLVVTEKRDILELWQIILIISVIVFVIVVTVIVIIIVRRKKQEHYGKHEKI